MRFLGGVWRLLVGVKDGLVLLFMLIFFGLLYAALTVKPYAGNIGEGALLLELSGAIAEQSETISPIEVVTGSSLANQHRLRDLTKALKRAAKDDRIKAVALDLDTFVGGGQTAVATVADAVEEVRRAGKPVVAYGTGYIDDSYQLAAHASEIWLNPMGGVLITGPGGSNLYYKELLDKIGVTANVYRAGTYKAAVEPYTRNDMSPESREANEALAASLWESWQQDVRQARPKAQIAAYTAAPRQRVAEAQGDLARAALRAGLVDRLGDRTAFEARMAELVGTDEEDVPGSYRHTRFDAYAAANPAHDASGQIGVLTVAGTIVDGEAELGTAGGDTIAEAMRKGLERGNLKALVVRVDSPGGSTLASERIRQAVLSAKAKGLPVIISMGSVAASGGYWIATAGDRIFAEPTTITGSIGVFAVLPSFEGTLRKLGIGADGVRTTPLSGQPDLLGGISEEAASIMQMSVDSTYRRFVAMVSKTRKIPPQRVNEIAQGRVWAGGAARQLGLVDQFGSLDDAIAEAARRAKLDPEEVKVAYLEREPDFWEQMAAAYQGGGTAPAAQDVFSRIAARPEALLTRAIEDARQIASGPAIQARCLECPSTQPLRPRMRERSIADWLWGMMAG